MEGNIPQRNRLKKIISIQEAAIISTESKNNGKSVVVVGGCFDLLHIGHILFLEKARAQGDILFLLLESDSTIKKRKGRDRPINSQKNRAYLLSKLEMVDFVIPLKGVTKDAQYDRLMSQMKPNVLATTFGDPNIRHKERQAKLIGSTTIKFVTKRIPGFSSTELNSDYRS